MTGDPWLRPRTVRFLWCNKYPANCLPPPETVELFRELGGRDGEVLQGELLGRPRAAGGVGAPRDLPLREGPPRGFLLLKARAQTHAVAAGRLLQRTPPGTRV